MTLMALGRDGALWGSCVVDTGLWSWESGLQFRTRATCQSPVAQADRVTESCRLSRLAIRLAESSQGDIVSSVCSTVVNGLVILSSN